MRLLHRPRVGNDGFQLIVRALKRHLATLAGSVPFVRDRIFAYPWRQASQEKGARWNPINNPVSIVLALLLVNLSLVPLESTVIKNAVITASSAARLSVSRERASFIICGPRTAMSWKPLACWPNAIVCEASLASKASSRIRSCIGWRSRAHRPQP